MLVDLLNKYKVATITNSSLTEVTDEGAVLTNTHFQRQSVSADTVVISVGFKPDQKLYHELNGKVADLYMVGDAYQAANIMNAVWSGNEIGMNC